jgi:hypothetical protein
VPRSSASLPNARTWFKTCEMDLVRWKVLDPSCYEQSRMNRISRNIAYLILMIVAVQCGSREKVQTGVVFLPPELSDPYLQSFRNKNIKYITSERLGRLKDPYPDTIDFDRRGNIVRIKRYGEEEKRAYDANDFLVRRWQRSDVTVQYIARYSIHGDTLVQSWRELNSRDWDLRGDTITRPHKVKSFVFDRNGRLIHEFIDGSGPMIYIYSKNKLVRKEIEQRRNDENEFSVERTAEFDYDDLGEIKTVKSRLLDGQDSEYLFYFSKGLLDSCQYRVYQSLEQRYKYQYVYY